MKTTDSKEKRSGRKKRRPLIERFEEKIFYSPDGCWYWTGTHNGNGYGLFCATGDGDYSFAHRCSYEFYNGKIAPGMLVCHHCDNPLCVNPNHLFLGTHKDNSMDMIRKNRRKYDPHKPAKSKLSVDDVLVIREMHLSGFLNRDISYIFPVNESTISSVVTRRTWKKVI